MRKTLACAALILLIRTTVQAGHVIPGVRRDLSDREYQLAWTFMAMYAINNCYEGPSRSVSRTELQSYVQVFGDMKKEILRRQPNIDSYLLFKDVIRGASHPFVERNPSGWICNYARLNVARIYYELFPARCAAADGCRNRLAKACPEVENGNVSKYDLCPDAEIEKLARGGFLPVEP